ncbi:MAG TPA: hypothetical protein VK639_00360 [Terriglobales bacterium]|nr:hypothetical protein [Terriglobales bacterium]
MTQQRKGSFRAFRLFFAPLQALLLTSARLPAANANTRVYFNFEDDTFDAAG